MRILGWSIVVLGIVLSAGCQPAPRAPGTLPEPSPSLAQPQRTPAPVQGSATPDRSETTVKKTPERVPPTAGTPSTGEVPAALLDAILKDLAQRTGASHDQFTVTRAEATVWNDGSLGCPKPGVMYTQSLVNGYWVVVKVGDQQYDYRANHTGYFFICENGLLPRKP